MNELQEITASIDRIFYILCVLTGVIIGAVLAYAKNRGGR